MTTVVWIIFTLFALGITAAIVCGILAVIVLIEKLADMNSDQ